jgi:SNF2 family DNA or RNA helicase
MPRVNLLIADDVGLGKTIEAGLVVQELILRHRVRTVLVVCPSSLQILLTHLALGGDGVFL